MTRAAAAGRGFAGVTSPHEIAIGLRWFTCRAGRGWQRVPGVTPDAGSGLQIARKRCQIAESAAEIVRSVPLSRSPQT
jgi:hypothetical protein